MLNEIKFLKQSMYAFILLGITCMACWVSIYFSNGADWAFVFFGGAIGCWIDAYMCHRAINKIVEIFIVKILDSFGIR